MRRTALALGLAVAALTAAPLAGTSNAGCVEDYLETDSQAMRVIVKNPDGSYTIYPDAPGNWAGGQVAGVVWLADCIV